MITSVPTALATTTHAKCSTSNERELITFTAIVTLGGCEPQAKAHAAANISVGNSRQDLLDALTIALPYIGYPRTLNGLSCVNAIAPSK